MSFNQRPPNPRLQRTRSAPRRSPLSRKPFGPSHMRALAVICLICCGLSSSADGKCSFQTYIIRAEVLDARSRTPIGGAVLTFFANGDKEAWPIEWRTTEPEFYSTDNAGRFEGVFHLSTDSGAFVGLIDRCNRTIKKLRVVIARSGYLARRVEFKAGQITWGETGDQAKILELPPIELRTAP